MRAATQTEEQEATPVERLAPEDLAALRQWVVDRQVAPADDAVTLADIAEATGLPASEVQIQLDRIREERAHQVAPAAPRLNQRVLLALAIVLFAGAGAVRVLTPRPLTEEEFEARAKEILEEKRRSRPLKPIHYPIESKVTTEAIVPNALQLVFSGPLTKTMVTPKAGGPMARQAAIDGLTKALREGYDAAREAEAKAPIPAKPLPKRPETFGWGSAQPGALSVAIGFSGGNTVTVLNTIPPPGFSAEQFAKDIQQGIGRLAESIVEGQERSQEMSLKQGKMTPRDIGTPPPGFSIVFKGREQVSTQASSLSILPVDLVRTARKLEFTIRNLMWRDVLPPDYGFVASRAAWAKRAPQPFADVRIVGPGGPIDFRLPMIASDQYPTAADAARASERILKEGIGKAVQQLKRFEKGGSSR
jgi:hypothetical protein